MPVERAHAAPTARLPVMTDSRDRSVVASTLTMLTCLVLGLLAGGMLVIAVSFVSFRWWA